MLMLLTFVDLLPRPASSGDPLGCAGKRETRRARQLESRHRRQQTTNSPGEAGGEAVSAAATAVGRLAGGSLASQSPESTGLKDQRSYVMTSRRFKIEIDLHSHK